MKRYCEMCDEWFPARMVYCPACGMKTIPAAKEQKTRAGTVVRDAEREQSPSVGLVPTLDKLFNLAVE